MAYSPAANNPANIAGCFKELEFKSEFEYASLNPSDPWDAWAAEEGYTHKVYVGGSGHYSDQVRAARISKTRAYVLVDEGTEETWKITKKWER